MGANFLSLFYKCFDSSVFSLNMMRKVISESIYTYCLAIQIICFFLNIHTTSSPASVLREKKNVKKRNQDFTFMNKNIPLLTRPRAKVFRKFALIWQSTKYDFRSSAKRKTYCCSN